MAPGLVHICITMSNLKPIVIGITGHRQLRKQDIPLLKEAVRQQLEAVALKCPNSPVKLLTSLAEGADQLCAEVALELNIGLIVALPMEISEYKRDFTSGVLFNFEQLISKAEKVFVVPQKELRNQSFSRDYYYRQADIYIATHSLALLALWDGTSPSAGGCGTAETVDIALNHSYESKRFVHNQDAFVIHILTPRNPQAENVADVNYLGNEDLFNESLVKIDELNKDGGDPDFLSIQNGKKYHKNLMLLAILGTILTMAFLLYDEVMIKWMLIVLGVILVIMSLVFKFATKTKAHQKYIEYRSLAECLRVQNHLNHCGIKEDVSEFLDWTRRFDNPWILKAVQTANVICSIDNTEDIKQDWIIEQQHYHEQAAEKAKLQEKRNNTILKTVAIASILIYLFALVFEYGISGYFDANIELVRTIIKVSVGTASAAGLFAANYYGKLSLKRVYEDHIIMANYFKNAADYLEGHTLDNQFLFELINEELSENSNWCSYEKDNEIGMII